MFATTPCTLCSIFSGTVNLNSVATALHINNRILGVKNYTLQAALKNNYLPIFKSCKPFRSNFTNLDQKHLDCQCLWFKFNKCFKLATFVTEQKVKNVWKPTLKETISHSNKTD